MKSTKKQALSSRLHSYPEQGQFNNALADQGQANVTR